MTTGMLPWNERLSIIDKVALGRSFGAPGEGGQGVNEPAIGSAQQVDHNLKKRDDIIQKKFDALDDRLGVSSSVDWFVTN